MKNNILSMHATITLFLT